MMRHHPEYLFLPYGARRCGFSADRNNDVAPTVTQCDASTAATHSPVTHDVPRIRATIRAQSHANPTARQTKAVMFSRRQGLPPRHEALDPMISVEGGGAVAVRAHKGTLAELEPTLPNIELCGGV